MANTFSITVTPEQAEKLSSQFGDSGSLPETSGVSLSYASDKTTNTVTFRINKKPFYVTTSMIQNRVNQLIGL